MFAIHAPQTVELTTDQQGEDLPGMINFSYAGADTSRCKMEIISKGRKWSFIFNQRGYLVEQSFDNGDKKDPEAPVLSGADFIVNGVDTRSFNPYTHVPPTTMDSAYLPTQAVAGPQSKEDRELRKKTIEAAHGDAQKAIDTQRKRMDEKPEETVARERKERDEKLKAVSDQLAKAPAETNQPRIIGEPLRNPDGSVVTPNQDRPDARDRPTGRGYDPLVPAPSSPLPNSAQPTRQNEPNHGVVNTTQSMNQPTGINAPAVRQDHPDYSTNRGNRDSKGRTSDDPNYDPFK